jgi:hypothetical protein
MTDRYEEFRNPHWEQLQRVLTKYDDKFSYCGSFSKQKFTVGIYRNFTDVTMRDVLSALSFTEFDFGYRLVGDVSEASGFGIVWIEGE